MNLNRDKRLLSENLRKIAMNRDHVHYDCFSFCTSCQGTGLDNFCKSDSMKGVTTWDCTSFCDKCEGIGFKQLRKMESYFICQKCNGTGSACSNCEGTGFVDWVAHARGK